MKLQNTTNTSDNSENNLEFTACLIVFITKAMNQPISELPNWLDMPMDLLKAIIDIMKETEPDETEKWKEIFERLEKNEYKRV